MVTSPLGHPLRSSGSSLTPAHLNCGCLPSTVPVLPVVSTHPSPHLVLTFPPPSLPLANDRHSSLGSADTHITFNPQESSTFRYTNKSFNIICVSGRMSADLGYDTVWVTWQQKLSQDWPWERPLLTPQDPVPRETAPLLTHKFPEWLTQRGSWNVDLQLLCP